MKQFAVIGLGRFGSTLVKTLVEMGHEVLAVDKSMEKVHQMMETATHVVQADAMEEEALRSVGICNFDAVIVAIGQDIQASILVSLILKEMGVCKVIAKAQNQMHGKVLEKIGVDQVVYPERDMAMRLAHNMVSANVLDYIELSPEYSIMEVKVGDAWAGKSLKDLHLRARKGATVILIKRAESEELIMMPGGEARLAEGDILVITGKKEDLRFLEE
ncbi:MAG: TrkA family potassium uptake protein [Thermoanaerobacteraceae bacterium]|nr:TrkA family potassium uptake protein [Thermoanaerobacteraceae bacterium]